MPPLSTPPSLLFALEEHVSAEDIPVGDQVTALGELFELFTTRRGELSRLHYLDVPRLRLAYLRYHLPLNFARSTCVLRDLVAVYPGVAELESVVDLGAGPGSSSLATLFALPPSREGTERTYILTDRSRAALRLARGLIGSCAAREEIRAPTLSTPAAKFPELPRMPRPSLVWLSMVLNEAFPPGRKGLDPGNFLRRLEGRLRPGSVLAIIEPALREPGRRLLEVHDRLAGSRLWEVLAPCTHQKACPLLSTRGRPWCHFHFAWEPGPFVEEVAAPLDLRPGQASFSYLVARRLAPHEARRRDPADAARVIGDPMRVSGPGIGAYACAGGRRRTLRKIPPTLERGDRILCAGETVGRVEGKWPG